MNRPPQTIKECVKELIHCIEATSCNYTQKQKGDLMDKIRVELVAYLKLKEYIQEES